MCEFICVCVCRHVLFPDRWLAWDGGLTHTHTHTHTHWCSVLLGGSGTLQGISLQSQKHMSLHVTDPKEAPKQTHTHTE